MCYAKRVHDDLLVYLRGVTATETVTATEIADRLHDDPERVRRGMDFLRETVAECGEHVTRLSYGVWRVEPGLPPGLSLHPRTREVVRSAPAL